MAKRCVACARVATPGHNRSHSNRQTLRRQNINLQTRTVDGKRVLVCAKCLKTANKVEKVKVPKVKKEGAKKVTKKAAKNNDK